MSDSSKDAKFSLKVMVNKEKNKVLFAEVDSSFADVLLSFLTLPLGTIVRILKNHYGDEAPGFGSLTTLYNSVANLDSVQFWTEGAKSILLHPRSTSEVERKSLRLDISDSQPFEYFVWKNTTDSDSGRFRSVSMYFDKTAEYRSGGVSVTMTKELAKDDTRDALFNEGVFTKSASFFVITDDMQIVPIDVGLWEIVASLGITETDKAELMNLTFGYTEVMDLLMAMLISSTPLSDIVLNRTGLMNSRKRKCEQMALSVQTATASTCSSYGHGLSLTVMLQKSTNQFLYALAGKFFVEFLFSFLVVPLGRVEWLLVGDSLMKSMDSLYRTIASDLTVSKHFTVPGVKARLIEPKTPHGYFRYNHILPLFAERLPSIYDEFKLRSENLPEGKGNYLRGGKTFLVTDDLTVTPFCIAPALSIINGMKVPLSDVKEVKLGIGLGEALGILRASLTSTSALSNGLGLINHVSRKQPRQEY